MKIFKDTFWLSISFLVGRGMSVIWNAYLARTLSDKMEELGVYMFILSQFALFSILAEGNVSYAMQHFISKENYTLEDSIKQYWPFSFYSKIILGIVFSFFLYFVVIQQYPHAQFQAFLIALTLLFYNIGSAPIGIFIAYSNFKVQITTHLINSLVFALSAIIAVSLSKNINIIISVLLLSNLIGAIYCLWEGFSKFGLPKFDTKIFDLTKKIIAFSLPLLVASFCFTFFYRMDINFIAKKLETKYVTYISLSIMFFFLIGDFLWSQLASAMTPSLLKKWPDVEIGRLKSVDQMTGLLSIYSVITSLLVVGLKIFGQFIFQLLLGVNGKYEIIIPILNYLLIGLPFMVSYAFLYRVYLLGNSSIKFMSYSLLFLGIKYVLLYLFFDLLGYQIFTILSGIVMVFVYLSFILFMRDLEKTRNLIVSNFLKVFAAMGFLSFYIFYFSEDNKSIFMIISGLVLCISIICIFWKSIISTDGKLILLKG
jgi:O-antigen/teichoic acid export membrane protein